MHEPERPRLCKYGDRTNWYVRHAGRRVSTGSASRTEAERFLAAYIAELEKPKIATVDVESILAAYLADRRAKNLPGATRLAYAHARLAARLGRLVPESLTERELARYAADRGGIATATLRTELQALKAAMRWAERKGLIARAPAVDLPPRPQSRQRWLTPEEADRLIEACQDGHLRLFTLIALHTAARSAFILALTWDRVDLEARRVDMRQPGRSRKRGAIVPINDTLLPVLRHARERATTPYVIEWGGGRVMRVAKGFRAAARRAGLTDVSPHTLRHTAASWMAQRRVPMRDIALFLGHESTRMVEEVYGHFDPDYLREAARALG